MVYSIQRTEGIHVLVHSPCQGGLAENLCLVSAPAASWLCHLGRVPDLSTTVCVRQCPSRRASASGCPWGWKHSDL